MARKKSTTSKPAKKSTSTRKKAGAPKGNKNAEVWTAAKAEKLVLQLVEYLEQDRRCRTVTGAMIAIGYYGQLVTEIVDKHPENRIVSESIKRAKDICATRLAEQALDGEANATMAIFILKNNHGFVDRIEQQQTILLPEPPVTTEVYTKDE